MKEDLDPKLLKKLDKLTSDCEFTSDGINMLVSFVRHNVSTTLARYIEKIHEQLEDMENQVEESGEYEAQAEDAEGRIKELEDELETVKEEKQVLKKDLDAQKGTCAHLWGAQKVYVKTVEKLKKFVSTLEGD